MDILKQLAAALNRPNDEPQDIDVIGSLVSFTLKDDQYCFDLDDGKLTQYASDGLTVVYEWKVKVNIV